MRLLTCNGEGVYSVTENLLDSDVPPYAILSHTWGPEEVTFRDIQEGTAYGKRGYNKLAFCAAQAYRDGLWYFWVDTCCIDKSSSSELQEAINSMFRWYRGAKRCYVYLADVAVLDCAAPNLTQIAASRWFTRGWTLQELLAPASVQFYTKDGVFINDRMGLFSLISNVTGVPADVLTGHRPLSSFSADERFAWMRGRQTTREEDMAYSLLGIFGVHMPLIYGEGRRNAFRRLREEIAKVGDDDDGADVPDPVPSSSSGPQWRGPEQRQVRWSDSNGGSSSRSSSRRRPARRRSPRRQARTAGGSAVAEEEEEVDDGDDLTYTAQYVGSPERRDEDEDAGGSDGITITTPPPQRAFQSAVLPLSFPDKDARDLFDGLYGSYRARGLPLAKVRKVCIETAAKGRMLAISKDEMAEHAFVRLENARLKAESRRDSRRLLG